MTVKKKSFIVTNLEMRGISKGEQERGDVGRRITQIYSDDGNLIFEYDPYTKESKVVRPDLLL